MIRWDELRRDAYDERLDIYDLEKIENKDRRQWMRSCNFEAAMASAVRECLYQKLQDYFSQFQLHIQQLKSLPRVAQTEEEKSQIYNAAQNVIRLAVAKVVYKSVERYSAFLDGAPENQMETMIINGMTKHIFSEIEKSLKE